MNMNQKQTIELMKQRVFEANLSLKKMGLIKLTWGNVSEINRELGVVVIKPSGVPYDVMTPEQMVVTDLEGNLVEKKSWKPSSDLPTHLVLYQKFKEIGGVVHTHSTNAVMWAQAGRDIPVYGTTHADTFYGSIPCTRMLTESEITSCYEQETGNVIVESFFKDGLDYQAIPAVIVQGHGIFSWGETPEKAVENSIILEEVAKMALGTEQLKKQVEPVPNYLLDKHYYRKHGKKAYYGQN